MSPGLCLQYPSTHTAMFSYSPGVTPCRHTLTRPSSPDSGSTSVSRVAELRVSQWGSFLKREVSNSLPVFRNTSTLSVFIYFNLICQYSILLYFQNVTLKSMQKPKIKIKTKIKINQSSIMYIKQLCSQSYIFQIMIKPRMGTTCTEGCNDTELSKSSHPTNPPRSSSNNRQT